MNERVAQSSPPTPTPRRDASSSSSRSSSGSAEQAHGASRSRPNVQRHHRGGGGSSPPSSGSGSSYDDYYYEEDEESEADSSYVDSERSGSQASLPQESLLSFAAFPGIANSLAGHRLMTVQAFSKYIVVGTNQGVVGLFDPTGTLVRLFHHHTDPISDVSCNAPEDYIGSSSKSGGLVVHHVKDSKDVWSRTLDTTVESVALHPQYHVLDEHPLACGSGAQVLLFTKTLLLNHRRSVVLSEQHGRVRCVRWSSGGDYIAAMTERAIVLFHYGERTVMTMVLHPADLLRPELYPCILLWESPQSLLCAWGDWIQEAHVRVPARPGEVIPPAQRVEVRTPTVRTSRTANPYRVCGLAPFGTARYVLLACMVEGEGVLRDLEVRVVDRYSLEDLYRGRMLVKYPHPLQLSLTYLKVHTRTHGGPAPLGGSSDRPASLVAASAATSSALLQSASHRSRVTDSPPSVANTPGSAAHPAPYASPRASVLTAASARSYDSARVGFSGAREAAYPPDGTQYLIVAADTILEATPCDEDDHVTYLLSIGEAEDAYEYALQHTLRRHRLQDVARQVLDRLLAQGEMDEAVRRLPELVGEDFVEWERWICVFDQRGEAWRLVGVLPPSKDYCEEMTKDGLVGLPTTVPTSRPVASMKPCIDKGYYDLVLLRCLERDPLQLSVGIHRYRGRFSLDVVTKATSVKYSQSCGRLTGLYSPASVASSSSSSAGAMASARNYTDAQKRALGDAYGLLLRLQGRDEEAFDVLWQVEGSIELFDYMREKQLFAKALDMVTELYARSPERTVQLLLEHVPPPPPSSPTTSAASGGGRRGTTASPNPPRGNERTSSASPPLPTVTAMAPDDPLRPESVVERLASCDRRLLYVYLCAVREKNRSVFASLARKRAQLLATLYIDFDRPALLPFLREMSMYLDKMREIHALCRKYDLLEEAVFLMARMGKEEDGLRILVQQMKCMRKAVQFVVDLPSRGDQRTLFRRLVQMTLEYNASLPKLRDGQRYFTHPTQPEDTYASISARYEVDEAQVRRANAAAAEAVNEEGADARPPTPCVVPATLLSSLLRAVAEPSFAQNPAIDAHYLIKKLPTTERIPHAGACIAAVTRSRAEDESFLSTVLHVAETDLSVHYGHLLKRRTAAVRIDPPKATCAFCQQHIYRGLMVFACHHSYHPSCVLRYLAAEERLTADPSSIDPQAFLERPSAFVRADDPKGTPVPHCRVCLQSTGVSK